VLKESKTSDQRLQVLTVILLPVFNEYTTLPIFIEDLLLNFDKSIAIVVVDDSKPKVLDASYKEISNIHILENNHKQGRGAAVRQGMKYAVINFPNANCIIESDSDGSHLVSDIVKIINQPLDYDLLIGSRYLNESQIINWPPYRRFFSSLLNFIIPKLININSTDLTNGLRSYRLSSAKIILSHKNILNGFMNLSETAKIISKHKLVIKEIPIEFTNRIAGKSSVTFKELFKSIKGLAYLMNFTGCDQCEF
jgi:dolichol-phosphate mannosyltransferase